MKWDELGAQEKNALIAEKVFGRRVHREDTWGRWLLYQDTAPGLTEAIPRYTELLNDAWKIVEKLREDENFLEFGISWQNRYEQDPPRVIFTFRAPVHERVTSAYKHYDTSAPTLAEAICVAALKACGVDLD